MRTRNLVTLSIVGLAFAIAGSLLLEPGIRSPGLGLIVALLCLIAAAIAGRAILGSVRVHRYYRLGVPLFAAVAAVAFTISESNWLIAHSTVFGPAVPVSSITLAVTIGGAVAYLVSATLYGFAGTSQGVRVGTRVGLLLLLLLAVVPIVNVLGLLGFVIVSAVRKPTSPAPAEASS